MNKKYIIFLIILGILTASVFFNYYDRELFTEKIKINEVNLFVQILDNNEERMRGLSGTTSLAPNEGMLFVFESLGFYGIWMKEMNFALDIAWLDENKKIIYIEKSVSPGTYPKVFNPNSRAQFVLEVNAGFFEKNKIKVGDSLETKAY